MGGQRKRTSVERGTGAVSFVFFVLFLGVGAACGRSGPDSPADAGGADDGTGGPLDAAGGPQDRAPPPDGVLCSAPCAPGQPCTRFVVAQHLNAIAQAPHTVFVGAVADLNGDGAADVLALEQAPAGWQWLALFGRRGQGLVDELVPVDLPQDISGYLLRDFDGDGTVDLAATVGNDQGSEDAVILPGRGDGTFGTPVTVLSPPATFVFALAAADFDGDHLLDLAIAYGQAQPRAAVFLGRGGGRFEQQPEVELAAGPPGGLYAGDLDRDGVPDLAFAAYSGAVMFHGDGHGGLSPPSQLPGPGSPSVVFGGDFDHDGRPDVMVCSVKYAACVEGFARDNGQFQSGSQRAAVLASGDLDGDGFPDVIDDDGIQLSQAGGGFVTAQPFDRAYLGLMHAFAIGDFAGDGQVQAVASTGDVWRLGCR